MAQNIKFANFVSTTLASSLATTATSLVVTSTTGFPSVTGGTYFYAVLKRKSDGHQEIVKVTKTDTGSPFTIVRAQDGTTDPGTSYVAADIVEIRLNAQALVDLYDEAAFGPSDISGAANKATPVDADEFALYDSAAPATLAKLTWANLKATLKTYFDSLYIRSGMIVLWSGSVAAIPAGWLLCDGTVGTPDLRSKFVVGAGSTYAVAATGGSADSVVVSHTHTATVTDPGHLHSGGTGASTGVDNSVNSIQVIQVTANTGSAVTGITVANSTNGVSGTNANLPPYYALAYIMKS